MKTAEPGGDTDETISGEEMLSPRPHHRHTSTPRGAAACTEQQPMEAGVKQCPHRSRERRRNWPRNSHTCASGEYGTPLPLLACWCQCPHQGLHSCRPLSAGVPWSPGLATTLLTARTCPQCSERGCQGSSWAGVMCEGLLARDGSSTAVTSGEHLALHGPLASVAPSSPWPLARYHHWLPIALVSTTLN